MRQRLRSCTPREDSFFYQCSFEEGFSLVENSERRSAVWIEAVFEQHESPVFWADQDPGPFTEICRGNASADGRKLAFASENRKVQAWMFPFDAKQGRVTGGAKPVTSPGMET